MNFIHRPFHNLSDSSPPKPKGSRFKPPRGFPTQVIGGATCQKLSPSILATYPCRWPAAARWISKSRGSINISTDLKKA